MMRPQFALLILLSMHIPTTLAQEARLSPGYLAGTWSLGGSEACGSGDYVVFRDNGTLEIGRGKTAAVAGFWELNNDAIILHMLVSPQGEQGPHPFYQSSYFYQYRSAQVLGTRADAFDVSVGAQQAPGQQYILSRCR